MFTIVIEIETVLMFSGDLEIVPKIKKEKRRVIQLNFLIYIPNISQCVNSRTKFLSLLFVICDETEKSISSRLAIRLILFCGQKIHMRSTMKMQNYLKLEEKKKNLNHFSRTPIKTSLSGCNSAMEKALENDDHKA